MDTVEEETMSATTTPVKTVRVLHFDENNTQFEPPDGTCQMARLPVYLPSDNSNTQLSLPGSRRMTSDNIVMQELTISRRQSTLAIRRPSGIAGVQRRLLMDILQGRSDSKSSLRNEEAEFKRVDPEYQFKMKNRKMGDDALTSVLSALYAKILVVLGIAFPITDILALKSPIPYYQGFYLFLYLGSVAFVIFVYVAHLRTRALFSMIDSYQDKKNPIIKKPVVRHGSFYLRVGAIAFGIGSMVYSGLEFGQYFEFSGESGCANVLVALCPAFRMILVILQMQFMFLNTKEFELDRHKVIARFGLMHMVATNLCEWLYVLVEETKHEIHHLAHGHPVVSAIIDSVNDTAAVLNGNLTITSLTTPSSESLATNVSEHLIQKRSADGDDVVACRRTNIMGTLVQNASPFLFPCTIEYSLICAVILFEMWKEIRGVNDKKPRHRKISTSDKGAHQFSVDCSRAHRGMFAGILVIVLSIISLIMFYVLSEMPSYHNAATLEVTISEMILYILTSIAVIGAFLKQRDLKFSKGKGLALDCILLILAQVGVFIYCLFSIIGCYFSIRKGKTDDHGGAEGLVAEVFSLAQTTLQTIFILNAWYRRCTSTQQTRLKPGREIVTFLLVANMAMWFLNTLVKNRAVFRRTHLDFFGLWGWTVITHISMPLAIFYRFHSTICLFEIWKATYKMKSDDEHGHH